MQQDETIEPGELIRIMGDIVSAHVSNNSVAVNDLPNLIANVHGALTVAAGMIGRVEITRPEPKASIRTSVKPDYIVCLDCGSRQKMMRRHLATTHNLTPEEYREKWGLRSDYPMVAPNYAEKRRELAVAIGLGRGATKGRQKRRAAA
jgi:predicted transcriptional regulator